ncbi:response regulator [Aquincola tertiaricarbonis]|uniref:histidine kinase n=1 Tax=Aquincola tertiaricarbonis TaxID=391953 RepID=A0ABY4SF32_AQUTE|nr:PAS domain-containing hybrid sensor histidine kinase/response regulator [Aquincola tertiaricarbonis]URI11629.1 response regulator [Aquincola tertiaricarbonis]
MEADIVIWSAELYHIFGLDPSRLPPTFAEHEQLYLPESWTRLQAAVQQLLQTGRPYRLDLEYRRADGSTGWLEARGAGERGEGGDITRLFGTARDITTERLTNLSVKRGRKLVVLQRTLRDERARAQKVEQALVQAKKLEVLGLLAGGIAHDFNNVLAAVSGSLHLLKRRSPDPEAAVLVRRGLGAVDRATRLVRQLMGFSRTQTIDAQVIDIGARLSDVRELLQLTVGPKIRVDIDVKESAYVLMDPYQLEVALLNLAINARDAMAAAGTLRVTTRREAAPGDAPAAAASWLALAVADTGAGMDAQTLARAREPFFTTKAEGQGTGLGLAMISAFAERSGGRFLLDSTLGAGTKATLLFPVVAGVDGTGDQTAEDEVDRSLHGNARVLVVEDDPLVRPTVVQYLRDLGYEVHAVDDAAKAIRLARVARPLDLVVTDVAMPSLDGPTLARAIRQSHPEAQVLLMTGHSAAAQVAGEAVLQKPFTQAQLAKAVLTALGRASQQRPSFAHRIHHPALVALYHAWTGARTSTSLTALASLELDTRPDIDSTFVVEIVSKAPFALKRLHVGSQLELQAAQQLDFGFAVADGDRLFAGLEAAYRRCARRQEPVYEYMRFQGEQGGPFQFERLLLPCADDSGRPRYLVGMVKIANLPEASSKEE